MCFENVPRGISRGISIVEKMGFKAASRRCGIHSKSQPLLQKTYISYASKTLAMYEGMCLRMQALAHICRPRATSVILFSKIYFRSFKRLYFPF